MALSNFNAQLTIWTLSEGANSGDDRECREDRLIQSDPLSAYIINLMLLSNRTLDRASWW